MKLVKIKINFTFLEVIYNATVSTLSSILEKNIEQKNKKYSNEHANHKEDNENIYKVQCFPLYSILLAVGRTHIDYFGLDVEGSEYKILKSIPWHKIDVKVNFSNIEILNLQTIV
jgi:hypothetical protein